MKIELKEGTSYIFKKLFDNTLVHKGKVVDLTKTSVKIKWETGTESRYLLKIFSDNYRILEELESDSFEETHQKLESL